jgi:hypothetical protein
MMLQLLKAASGQFKGQEGQGVAAKAHQAREMTSSVLCRLTVYNAPCAALLTDLVWETDSDHLIGHEYSQ